MEATQKQKQSNLNSRPGVSVQGEGAMMLTAKWKGGSPSLDEPTEIHWEDGSPATLQDYIEHSLDTHRFSRDRDGMLVCTMFPDIVADVRFDPGISRWICQAPGHPRVITELPSTPEVSDEEIIAELYTYPVVYKAAIHRDGWARSHRVAG